MSGRDTWGQSKMVVIVADSRIRGNFTLTPYIHRSRKFYSDPIYLENIV